MAALDLLTQQAQTALSAREANVRETVEVAARTPLGDDAFARYLTELAAFELPVGPP